MGVIIHPSASFQNIVDIYNFDHELRHIILKYIEIIEVEFKSIYAYEFTKVFGSTGYLNKMEKKSYEDGISG